MMRLLVKRKKPTEEELTHWRTCFAWFPIFAVNPITNGIWLIWLAKYQKRRVSYTEAGKGDGLVYFKHKWERRLLYK